MKRILAVAFIVMLLCGCSAKEAIASDKQEYIVASLGFDSKGSKIEMFIEAIVVNTDDLDEDKQSIIMSGIGGTIEEAYSEIISEITQPLSLGHNAVTVIGSGLSSGQLESVFEFCRSTPQINPATMLIYCDSANKLLACEPLSSIAVGYDIMSMIEVTEEQKGTIFKNRLYEAEALRQKPMKTFYIPYLSVEEKKFSLDGLQIFEDNKPNIKLENDEVPLFCLITDSATSGVFTLNSEKFEVKYSKASYDFKNNSITVNLRLRASGNVKELKAKTQELLQKEDIFSLGNIIYQKEQKIWNAVKNDYQAYYKNAEKRVNIHE